MANKVLSAELVPDQRLNKKQEPYEMLMVYVITKSGEKVLLQEIFMNESLKSIVNHLSK